MKISNQVQQGQPNFMATPKQILNALEVTPICPGKTRFLGSVADAFSQLQNKLAKNPDFDSFEYNLTKSNDIPEFIKNTNLADKTGDVFLFKSVDEQLQNGAFECSPTSKCGCGAGKTLANFAADLLKMLGVENPEKIVIKK